MGIQAPASVVVVRPESFQPNPATADDNKFQQQAVGVAPSEISARAYREVTEIARVLESYGVRVHSFDDERVDRPDSVFPNNWFSTHPGGQVAIYPMYSPSRRAERRPDIIDMLKANYRVQEVFDFSGLEHDEMFLEGTGAMVLDHVARLAYTCRSNRANPFALERFCTRLGYEPMAFDAFDDAGTPVYHTNVMMCVATDFALIGLDMIADKERRNEIADRIAAPGRDVIALTHQQIGSFAGNAIELQGSSGRILAMSSTALSTLTAGQRATIERFAEIVAIDIPTIELAGGSVRCMLAGIHLEHRPPRYERSDSDTTLRKTLVTQ